MKSKTDRFEYMRRIVKQPELAKQKYGTTPPGLRPKWLQRKKQTDSPVQTTIFPEKP